MAYDATKPATGSSPVAADIRENFRALKADRIVDALSASTIVGQGSLATLNSVGAAQISANAVHTSELYTLSGSTSTTAAGVTVFTMTGGLYCFIPQMRTNNGTYRVMGMQDTIESYSTSYATKMTIATQFPGTSTAYMQWQYVSASPPHDMGDGDIPLFLYALVDKNGKIVATHFAEDPIWLANGPTQAMPNAKLKDGTLVIVEKALPPSVLAMPVKQRVIAARDIEPSIVLISEELKHRDKDLIPHPWVGMDLATAELTVVMMDPVSQTVRDLSELRKDGEDLDDIMYNDYVKIGNTGLNRVTPNGLLIPSTTWK